MYTNSTARTASKLSSGIGGDSEDEARLEEGRTSIKPATRRKSDGGIGHGSTDPSSSSVSASVATAADATIISNSTATDNNEHSRRTGAHGGETENDGGGGGRGRGGIGHTVEVWDFERLGRTPLLAAAFEDFSRKALCHESVFFLSEVSR